MNILRYTKVQMQHREKEKRREKKKMTQHTFWKISTMTKSRYKKNLQYVQFS